MKSGDIFIFKSDFHKMDIGIIFLETQIDGDVFIPVLFENNYFDNTVDAIYRAKIKTNSNDPKKIRLGGGSIFPIDKLTFDKFHVPVIVMDNPQYTKSDIKLILKN